MKNRSYHEKLVSLFIFCLVIINSGHALQSIFPKLAYVLILAVLIVAMPILKELSKFRVSIYLCAPYLFLLMFGVTCFLHAFSDFGTYALLGLMIFTAFGITLLYTFQQFVRIYLNTMTVTTVVAIIGYILLNNTNLLSNLPKMINVNNVVYKIGIIYNYIVTIPERNCGMFWEPGLFATFLLFAIVFELVFKEGQSSKLRLLLFSTGILTANSSAGFLLLMLCVILALTRPRRAPRKRKHLETVLLLATFTMGLLFLLNLDNIIRQTNLIENPYIAKLLSENIAESSRALALQHNLRIFLENPIFGSGFANVSHQMKHVADTSTSTFLMSVFGISGALYTFLFVYGVLKIKKINGFSKIVLITLILCIINKEPHHSNMFTWCLMFYLLKGESNPNMISIYKKVTTPSKKIQPVFWRTYENY